MERLNEQLALLPEYLSSHLTLTLAALLIGIAICIPLAVLVTRVKSLQWPTLTIASILQTIPGIALLALMVPLLSQIGFLPALLALTIYSMLPILRNTVTGILEIESSYLEAADALGMTSMQRLRRVELPLASPVIIAGIRTATVWVVGTATLSTPVGATSLGNYIFSGLQTQNFTAVTVGCVAAAALAIVLDQLIRVLENIANPLRKARAYLSLAALVLLIGLGIAPTVTGWVERDEAEEIIIGAKTFTEQFILSEALAEELRGAGFSVSVKSSMGSTILFDALVSGEVDCYVDYSGTIWANHMQREDNPGADSVLTAMTHWLDSAHSVTTLGALGFDNTYALAVTKEFAGENNVSSIADLSALSANMRVGSDYELFGRPEWESVVQTYDLKFSDLVSMDHALMYAAIDEEAVDVIAAYSTDGHIAAYDLQTLSDPAGAFPPYDAVLLISERAARNIRLTSALRKFIGALDADLMRSSNKRVDFDGAAVEEAARELLERLSPAR